jgi:hypothetical protein
MSSLRGVSYCKNSHLYKITKTLKGKRYFLGYKKTYEEALEVVKEFNKEHYVEAIEPTESKMAECKECGAIAKITQKGLCYSCTSTVKKIIPKEYLVRGYKYPWERKK